MPIVYDPRSGVTETFELSAAGPVLGALFTGWAYPICEGCFRISAPTDRFMSIALKQQHKATRLDLMEWVA